MRLARLAAAARPTGHRLPRSTRRLPLTKVQPVRVGLNVIPRPPVLLLLGIIVALQNLLLESTGTLVKDGEELLGEPLNLLNVAGGVHVRVPGLTLA